MSISRFAFVSCVLLTVHAEVLALSLGPVQGRAWLGNRLAVQVPVYLHPDEINQDLCVQVLSNYMGEESQALTLDYELVNSQQAQTKMVLLKSRQLVQDFVVHFGVSVGCASVIRRQYTLLIDPPPVGQPAETTAPTTSAAVARAATAATTTNAATPTQTPASSSENKPQAPKPRPDSLAKKSDRNTRNTQEGPQPNAPSRPHTAIEAGHDNKPLTALPASSPAVSSTVIAASDLNLNEIEFLPPLKMDSTPPSFEGGNEAQREEFRQLWSAIQTPLEVQASNNKELLKLNTTLIQKEEKIKSIENQNQQLQTIANEDSKWYSQASLIISIILLLLSWALFIIFLMKTPYWHRIKKLFNRKKQKNTSSLETQFPSDAGLHSSEEVRSQNSLMNFDSIFPEDELEKFRKNKENLDSKPLPFSNSTLNEATRAVATEELFDLQQQVEFFISLGQAHQAVEVLKAYISENEERSPLAYLDLLKLQYDLGLQEDYEHTRREFNAKFNAGTPSFEHYSYSRRSLERYPLALSRIQALWPGPSVLALLERTIFKQEMEDEQAAIFDLEAYRELLLLYGIARELNNPSDKPISFNSLFSPTEEKVTPFEVSGFPEFSPTRLQPLNATFIDDLNKDLNESLHDVQAKNLSSQFPDVFLDTLKDNLRDTPTQSETEKNKPQNLKPNSPVTDALEQKTRVFSLKSTEDLKLDFSDLDSPDQGKAYKIKKS